MANLQFLLMICYDRAAVHFRAGANHCQDTSNRDDLIVHIFHLKVIFFPWIFRAVCRYGNRFCIVADRTTPNRKDQVCLTLSGNLTAFLQFLYRWIWHDACIFQHIFSICFQNLHDFIIDAILFDRPAAIHKLHILSILRQFFIQAGKGILAEIKLRRVAIRKIS